MSLPNTTKWIRTGLLALPVYGLLTVWSTLEAQPDQTADPEAWARFVGSDAYVMEHMLGALGGAVFAILGIIALGAYLAKSRAGRLGLTAMVMAVVGQALGLVIGGISTFVTPAVGRAYLAGITDVMQLEFPTEMTIVFALALLFMFVGSMMLGVAVWKSGILPKGAGVLWLVSTLLFYVLGAVLGMATTGSSLPTQPVGALLMAISGAWMAWSAMHQTSSRAVAMGMQS